MLDTIQQPHVIVTGASSGVGLFATAALIQQGWPVVMACRNLQKARRVAQVVVDKAFSLSGVHWSWGNRQVPSGEAFAQALSAKATQMQQDIRLWDLSSPLVGIAD
jgi:NAD(P)-dependent dehydrogenase (short-subunit alcohol dehydrogenase family)